MKCLILLSLIILCGCACKDATIYDYPIYEMVQIGKLTTNRYSSGYRLFKVKIDGHWYYCTWTNRGPCLGPEIPLSNGTPYETSR